jgi:hypothetical protein
MSAIRWCSIAVLACGALAACDTLLGKELNPKFCAAHPDDSRCRGDASQSCSSTAQCTAPLVCDVGGTNTCVQCTPEEDDACTGATPVCGDDRTCRGCTAHAECGGSDACLPSGACADPAQVAYVKPMVLGGSDNPNCTLAMPCTKVTSALQTGRAYVKIAGTNDEGGTISIDSRNVMLLAERDAKLTRTSIGLHVQISGTSEVEIYDLEISGALGTQGIGISMPPGNAAKLTLRRVKLLNNQGGGISVSGGTFNITNSFIVRNGDELAGTFGGLSLGIATPGNNRLEFNTIVDNKAAINSAGVVCNVPAFMAPNNIVARNNLAGSTTAPGAQTTVGGCTYPSSRIQNDVSGLMFEHPDPPGTLSYKLLLGSAAIDQATTPSDIVEDFEGQPRPSGPGKDIGADELQQ